MPIPIASIGGFVKAACKVFKDANKIDLQKTLLDFQAQLIAISEDNTRLASENIALKQKLKLKGTLRFEENCYNQFDRKGNKISGPYCTPCWDKDNKLVHMHQSIEGKLWCPACNKYGGIKSEGRLKYRDNAYYEYDEKGNCIGGPLCSGCYDSQRKIIYLHTTSLPGLFRCPACNKNGGHSNTKEYRNK